MKRIILRLFGINLKKELDGLYAERIKEEKKKIYTELFSHFAQRHVDFLSYLREKERQNNKAGLTQADIDRILGKGGK